jgi:hypothetical protein
MTSSDFGYIEAIWWNRYPKIEWGFCSVEKCSALTVMGEMCAQHFPEYHQALPSWKWVRGDLYRLVRVTTQVSSTIKGISSQEYQRNDRRAAAKLCGEIPYGYRVCFVDGNPFNHRRENLVVLSKYATAALKSGDLTVADAVEMDSLIEDFISRKCRRGMPQHKWLYGYAEVARYLGVDVKTVYKRTERRVLDMEDFSSVIDFCVGYKQGEDQRRLEIQGNLCKKDEKLS